MKQALWMALIFLSVLGCKQQSPEMVSGPKNPGSNPGGNDPSKPTTTTDFSQCIGKPLPLSAIYNSWSVDFQVGAGRVHHTYTIEKQGFVHQVDCAVASKSISVAAHVSSSVNGSEILTLTHDSMERSFDDGVTSFRCSVGMDAQERIQLSFEGPCLRMKSPKRNLLLVPAQ